MSADRIAELEAENERLRLAAVRAEEALRQMYYAALPVVHGGGDDRADWARFAAALEPARLALAAAGADTP